MNRPTLFKQIMSTMLTTVLIVMALSVFTACSKKPSAEESAAQTKALADQAVAEAKKQILAEQAAEKAKQDELAAAQAEEKVKHDAAVAEAKRQILAEQRKAHEKSKSVKQSVVSAPAYPTPPDFVPPPPPPMKAPVCANCGIVLSVVEKEDEGQGSGLGVVAGGLVGGLLGNQVGKGTGRDLATIAGAVGGAVAGNKIEKNAKKTKSYDIKLKMDTGEEYMVHQASAPNVAPGDKVRVENNVIVK